MNINTHTFMRHHAPTTIVSVDGKDVGHFVERTDRLRNGTPLRVYVTRMGLPGNACPAVEIHTRDAAIAWIAREAREEHRI